MSFGRIPLHNTSAKYLDVRACACVINFYLSLTFKHIYNIKCETAELSVLLIC